MLSAAPAYLLMGKPRGGVYAGVYGPLLHMHEHTAWRGALDRYAAAMGAEGMFGEAADGEPTP
jgi:hypothetical protein